VIWNDFKSNHKISNQIQIKSHVFQIKSLFFKSNHYMWFNHDLNQIMIWICPSLPVCMVWRMTVSVSFCSQCLLPPCWTYAWRLSTFGRLRGRRSCFAELFTRLFLWTNTKFWQLLGNCLERIITCKLLNALSTVGMLCDSAPYKFTIDIDVAAV